MGPCHAERAGCGDELMVATEVDGEKERRQRVMSAWCSWCAKTITLEKAEEGFYACCGSGFCSKKCKDRHVENGHKKD